MKTSARIFRIQGIVVFVVVAGFIAAFLILLLDSILKDSVENQGTRILRAQVDVNSLATSLMSQSIDIGNLEVANADLLNENLLEAGRIKFDFDLGRAFSKKIIIEDMRLEGLRFNQQRKTPAQPYRPPEEGKSEPQKIEKETPLSGFGFAQALKFKSPGDILKEEKLETLESIDKARNEIESLKSNWQTRMDQQLNPDVLKQMQQRIQNLKAQGKNLKDPAAIQAFTAEIQAVRREIQSHLDTIHNFQKNLEKDIRKAGDLAVEMKGLPQKDFARLRKKYSLDLKGGAGFAGKMVSGPLKTKIDKGWRLYQQISPYLKSRSPSEPDPAPPERGKGQFIKFPAAQRSPDFLIRKAGLSLNIQGQEIDGNFSDLTDDPQSHGKPFLLNLTGGKSERFNGLKFHLSLDRTRPQARDSLKAEVKSLNIPPIPFGSGIALTQGRADIQAHIHILDEQNLDGTLDIHVQNALFTSSEKKNDEVQRLLGKVLGSVQGFYLKVRFKGTPAATTLDIQSDLDQILAQSVRKVFDEKAREFEGELKRAVTASTKLPLSETSGWTAGLTPHRKELNSQESAYQELLKQATEKVLLNKVPGADTILKQFKLPF